MSNFENENPDLWAAWQAREFVAKLYAMPLRTITEVYTRVPDRPDGIGRTGRITKAALLECGHWGELLIWLRVGQTMRCRHCYEGGLREAQRMIERVGLDG